MKRFITFILCTTVFFIGLGGLIERAGATFKSDEKALELIRKARQAIGGDTAINSVKSMTIKGKVAKTFETENTSRIEGGETEINFELPNKISKQLRLGAGDGDQMANKQVNVVIVQKDGDNNAQWRTENDETIKTDGVKRVIVKKADGTEEVLTENILPVVITKQGDGSTRTSEDRQTTNVEGKKFVVTTDETRVSSDQNRQNELFRTTLSLILTAPEGLDVSYTYIGEGNVDGDGVEIVEAQTGGSKVKLFLDRSTNLPRMVTFQAIRPMIFVRVTKEDVKPDTNGDVKVFTREMPAPQMAEFQVKYSDYRIVNGIQLPFKWTQTINGKTDETVDVSSYEINPANIAEKFKEMPMKVMVRTTKP